MKLETLIKKYDLFEKRFELLCIDAEGTDGLILTTTDFTKILPKYIRFENCHLRDKPINAQKTIKHLNKYGYSEVDDIYKKNIRNFVPGTKLDTLLKRKDT